MRAIRRKFGINKLGIRAFRKYGILGCTILTALNILLSCSANFLNSRKCIFCGALKVNKTARRYIKCDLCLE